MDSSPTISSTRHHLYDPHFEERTRLDQEILQLEKQLHLLRIQRNGLLPIFTIPTDVLVDVFKLASSSLEGVSPIRIVDISWVCRVWRNVALQSPILWADIHPALSPRWMKAFLERSKPANVSIGIKDPSRQPYLTTSLIQYMHRIRHLKLMDSFICAHQMLASQAPLLQSLDLSSILLPQVLFSGKAPSLTKVHLTECNDFRFNALPLLQLTDLTLGRPNPRPLITEILTALSTLHNLQSFTLNDAFDSKDSGIYTDLRRVNLPNLRFLRLSDVAAPVHFITTLVCQISSPNATMHIATSDILGHIPAYIRLLTYLQAFEPHHKLSLFVSYVNMIASIFVSDEVNARTNVEAGWRWIARTGPIEMLQELPLETLASITFEDYTYDEFPLPFPYSFWSETLSPLPNLRELRLSNMYAVSFMIYMSSLPAAVSSMQPTSKSFIPVEAATPFPALRSLTLQDLPFSNSWKIYPEVPRSFYKVLQRRMLSGVGLEELVQRNFSVDKFDDVPLTACAERVFESWNS